MSAGAIAAMMRGNRRGVAVVMALSVVLLMTTVAMELLLNERAKMIGSAVYRDQQTLDQMARSAVELATAVLIKDRIDSETDSLQENWADEEFLTELLAQIPFAQGTVSLKIIDETSKIQINALVNFPAKNQFNEIQHQLWERFADGLLSMAETLEQKPETDAATIINSIKDWIDSEDDEAITGLSGAESDYYESLDPPYACKNGPLDHLSELPLIKGITPEIYSGAGGAAGLETYVTVYGATKTDSDKFSYPGKININTADLPVLMALLPPESAEFAQLIVDFRQATSGTRFTNDLTRADWYRNIPGMSGTTINKELITLSSTIFRIIATARLNNVQTVTTVVVERRKPADTGPWQCKVLNWKTQ